MKNVDNEIAKTMTIILGRKISPGENIVKATEPEWDSLRHIEVIFALEHSLGVQFNEEEVLMLDSSESIKNILEKKHVP